MLKIHILSLFPTMFNGFLKNSIIKRAIQKKIVKIKVINFRNFSHKKNQQVDDTSFGGGPGMVLMCEPIINALEAIDPNHEMHRLLCSPKGNLFNQAIAQKYSQLEKDIVILCGHYEEIDARVYDFFDDIISIGDYVVTGGELPAMLISDAVVRLLPNVINQDSLDSESFTTDLLDYDHYTKPQNFRNLEVPKVLLSGNHQEIKK